jgi:hypothetical protein
MRTITIRLGLTPSVCEPAAMVRWLRHHDTLFHPALCLEWSVFLKQTLLPLSAPHGVMDSAPSKCRGTTLENSERKQERSTHRHFNLLIFARTSPILQGHQRIGEKA